MKILLVILINTLPFLGFSQNENEEKYYRNGNLKWQRLFQDNQEIIKEYYRNGQISYLNIKDDNNETQEFYSRKGVLTARIINGLIVFNIYEYHLENIESEEDSHHHGHDHDHGHHH